MPCVHIYIHTPCVCTYIHTYIRTYVCLVYVHTYVCTQDIQAFEELVLCAEMTAVNGEICRDQVQSVMLMVFVVL